MVLLTSSLAGCLHRTPAGMLHESPAKCQSISRVETRGRRFLQHQSTAWMHACLPAHTHSPPTVAPHLAFGMSPSSIVAVMPGSPAEPLPQAPVPSYCCSWQRPSVPCHPQFYAAAPVKPGSSALHLSVRCPTPSQQMPFWVSSQLMFISVAYKQAPEPLLCL